MHFRLSPIFILTNLSVLCKKYCRAHIAKSPIFMAYGDIFITRGAIFMILGA